MIPCISTVTITEHLWRFFFKNSFCSMEIKLEFPYFTMELKKKKEGGY